MVKRVGIAFIGFLVIIAIINCATGTEGQNEPSESPAAAATSTAPSASASAQVAPSESPTLAEPNQKSEPSGATAEEQAFAATIVHQSKTMADSFRRFAELAHDPKFFDDTWKLNVAVELATWRTTYSEAQKLTPPSAFEPMHQKYLDGLSKFNDASVHVAQGIDDLDPDALGTAAQKIQDGNQLIQEATAMLPR